MAPGVVTMPKVQAARRKPLPRASRISQRSCIPRASADVSDPEKRVALKKAAAAIGGLSLAPAAASAQENEAATGASAVATSRLSYSRFLVRS